MSADSTDRCDLCGRTGPLRRGKCPACYQRLRRGTVPTDPRCAACGCRDARVLRDLALEPDLKVTVCYNCAHLVGRATPRPASVEDLRSLAILPGDRRTGVDRRGAERRADPSTSFGEWDRRSSERRATPRPYPA